MSESRDEVPIARKPRRPSARTAEARERQLASLAYDLVEQRLRDGTASAQETTHFLRVGSSRELLEKERLKTQTRLDAAKEQQIADIARSEALFQDAMRAMSSYQSGVPMEDSDDDS